MPRDDKTVGLILVTYQSAVDLPPFLDAVTAAVGPYDLDVVGVDNVSTDKSVDLVEEFGGRVIRNSRNVGLATAINQGAAVTDAAWILVANPDTVLAPGSIAALVETAGSDDRIGMIGPRVARLDGTPYPSGRRFPSLAVGIAHALLGGLWPGNPATRRYFGEPLSEVGDVDWISGCCMLFRREAFDAVGGFDAGYFLYFEETKMALDMHRTGWRVVLDPTVEIRHREGGSMRSAPFRKIRSHHRSALRFYCDYHRGSPWLALAPLVAVGLIVRGLLAGARTAVVQRLGVSGIAPAGSHVPPARKGSGGSMTKCDHWHPEVTDPKAWGCVLNGFEDEPFVQKLDRAADRLRSLMHAIDEALVDRAEP
ncbi:glycosyltransferase family 2 protein [Nocardia otitidiscaviarum]|uniref:glycosyltransferase family 2 protein n=1 Tax=Nocardia otitidiscaviarum TaxID=1823 RepID=UPI001892F81C|nr:glycosyltransferase family 2 protein [Nocardia otitidiscaviarum]MBF6180387.1 glycosyltransferase family 2 protein [Nocardia otitidiscaviarum]